MQRTAGRVTTCCTAMTVTLAAASAGCSTPDSLLSSVALPASETPASGAEQIRPGASSPVAGGLHPSALTVTDNQRAYLDALAADGVHPSSDLLALSIGSYVCQAWAARQSPEAVWEFVHPLVSSDVRDARGSSVAPTTTDVDAATGRYIRIATERLC